MARVSLGDVTQLLAAAGLSLAVGTACTFESDGAPGPVDEGTHDGVDDVVDSDSDDGPTFEVEIDNPTTAPQPIEPAIVAFADNPSSVAADNNGLYWTEASTAFDTPSSVMGQPLTGSSAIEFSSHYGYATALVAHNGTLYWADVQNGSILSAPHAGGAPVVLVDDQQAPYAMAIDDNALYWTDIEAGTVMSYDFANGTVVRLAKDQDVPAAITLTPFAVVWTELGSGSVRVVPKAGGSWSTMVSGVALGDGLAADDHYIYYGDLLGQSVMGLSLADRTTSVIAADQIGVGAIAVDGNSLVWTTEEHGTIREMRTTGGTIRDITTQQADPAYLVARDGLVHWASVGDGAVWTAGLAF